MDTAQCCSPGTLRRKDRASSFRASLDGALSTREGVPAHDRELKLGDL